MNLPAVARELADDLLQRCRFPADRSVVSCAVSGGPDSTALLVLARLAGFDVTAHHVDHGVRRDSFRDGEAVASVAERFGAAVEVHRVDLEDGPNFEARARDARRTALPTDVLTGHTLDDQAETVLLFLLRGTGPNGVAGIGDPDRRPLLGLRRRETHALCRALDLVVVDDPMNGERRFVRNRIRHELLPAMDEIAGRDVAPLIARTASLQRDVLALVDVAATSLDPTDAPSLAAAPIAVASAAVRSWWRRETAIPYAPDAAAVARVLDVARGVAVATDVVDGWRVERRAQRLRLVAPLGGRGAAR